MNIGDRMKQLRKQKHISADTIAEKIGVSRSTIFRYEKGDIEKVPIGVVTQIADVIGVKPEELMGLKPKTIADEVHNVVARLTPDRQQTVFDFATDQLQQQHKEDEAHNDSVVKLQPKKSSTPDPFMPIAAHLDHELSDDERTEVDAWERKIAAEEDDDEDDDN